MKSPEPKAPWTRIGTGVHLDHPQTVMDLGFPDNHRKGHFWCFGTTRVGKTRIMDHIIEQDICKGYSVVAIDPKGDIDLFSKITQLAHETDRLDDLMLITPIFPQYSAILDPLSSYYMPEELVAHITAGLAIGREPYFFGVAYEVSLAVVQALIMLAEKAGKKPTFNLNDIKNHISHQDLEQLKEKIDYIDSPEAKQLSLDIQKILSTPADYYSKVGSSLRGALTELTSGNVGKIIGKADENRFIQRLEEGKCCPYRWFKIANPKNRSSPSYSATYQSQSPMKKCGWIIFSLIGVDSVWYKRGDTGKALFIRFVPHWPTSWF